jgi:hypothetical protein
VSSNARLGRIWLFASPLRQAVGVLGDAECNASSPRQHGSRSWHLTCHSCAHSPRPLERDRTDAAAGRNQSCFGCRERQRKEPGHNALPRCTGCRNFSGGADDRECREHRQQTIRRHACTLLRASFSRPIPQASTTSTSVRIGPDERHPQTVESFAAAVSLNAGASLSVRSRLPTCSQPPPPGRLAHSGAVSGAPRPVPAGACPASRIDEPLPRSTGPRFDPSKTVLFTGASLGHSAHTQVGLGSKAP